MFAGAAESARDGEAVKTKRVTWTLVASLVAGGVALVASFCGRALPDHFRGCSARPAGAPRMRGCSTATASRSRAFASITSGAAATGWHSADVSPALDRDGHRFGRQALSRTCAASTGRAVAAAVKQTLAGERRGGSTLTMQLAAYLNPGARDERPPQRPRQVAAGAPGARDRARAGARTQILEAWFNLTPFRGELEGIDAASRSLFGKRAGGLDRARKRDARGAGARAECGGVARRAARLRAARSRRERIASAREGIAAGGLRARPHRRATSTARRRTSRGSS